MFAGARTHAVGEDVASVKNKTPSNNEYRKIVNFYLTAFDERY